MIQRTPHSAGRPAESIAAQRKRAAMTDLGEAQVAFAQLWQGLLPLLPSDRATLGVAGVRYGSNSTMAAVRLAISAADLDIGPVLLLEATAGGEQKGVDGRELPSYFDAQANPGLRDWRVGAADLEACLQEIEPGRLSLLTCGSNDVGSASAASTLTLPQALEELGERFFLVVCDLGVATAVEFPAELVKRLDGILLVIEASGVTDRQAKDVKKQLLSLDGRLLGAIWSESARSRSGAERRDR